MKRMVIFCFFCCLILLVYFRYNLMTTFADWSLRSYAISKWGKALDYEKLDLKDGKWILTYPKLEDGVFFSAEQIVLDVQIDWYKRSLKLDIEISQPFLYLQHAFSTQKNHWEKLLNQEPKWFKTQIHVHAQSGLLVWESENLTQHHVYFDLENKSRKNAILQLSFDSPSFSSNALNLQISKDAELLQMSCSCKKLSCCSLLTLAQFFKIDLPPILIDSGYLQGNLKAIFPNRYRPYLEGDLLVENLEISPLNYPLRGYVEMAQLHLTKNQKAYQNTSDAHGLTFVGELEILKSASLKFEENEQKWEMKKIEGKVQVNASEFALIHLKAQGENGPHIFNWNVEGKANLNTKEQLDLALALTCQSSIDKDSQIHLLLQQTLFNHKKANLEIKQLSYAECCFLQNLLAIYWPTFNDVKLEQGVFSAIIEAEINERGIKKLQAKHLQAEQLKSYFSSWCTGCYCDQLSGTGQMNLEHENFWQTFDGECYLKNGEVDFRGIHPSIPIKDIQAQLLVQKGHIEHSLINLQFAGLKGKMDVEWGDRKQLLTFKLEGVGENIADFFPPFFKERLHRHFYQNQLTILANIKKQQEQFEMGGTLHIQRKGTNQTDLIHFGCDLKKDDQGHAVSFIPLGWFYAHCLPIDRFLAPFIFDNDSFKMSGEVEIKGSFDDQYLTLKYDAENLKIETDDLRIEIDQLHSNVPGQLIGSHQFNLTDFSHKGSLPIQQAIYFDKNYQILFEDVQGVVNFDNQFIHISSLEAYCDGIYFAGNMSVDFKDPSSDMFELKIQCPIFSGKFSQFRQLLTRFYPSSLLHQIPLEADILAKEPGLNLDFIFGSNHNQLLADVNASLTEGVLPFKDLEMALDGLYMDIEYHHNQNLAFNDIQGTLLIGKANRVEEYPLVGQFIRFHHTLNPFIELDVALQDQARELVRVVGCMQEDHNGLKNVYLDQTQSHVSNVYPQFWKCSLKEGFNIEQLELKSNFALKPFLEDLSLFDQTGLCCISHHCFEKISQLLPIEGEGFCHLQYDPLQHFTYVLEGKSIIQGDSQHKHEGSLKGSKLDKKWVIDQLQWDDSIVYAELQQMEDKWKIPFLGLKIGDSLLLGLEGNFLSEKGLLQTQLKFCEIDLEQLSCQKNLQSFMTKWWPKGKLKVKGNFDWYLFDSTIYDGLKANLLVETELLSIRDYPLQILKPFQLTIQAGQIIRLQNIQVGLFSNKSHPCIDVDELEYHRILQNLNYLKATFEVPSECLKSTCHLFMHHFPDFSSETIETILANCKQQGALKGSLKFEKRSVPAGFLNIVLEDGWYTFHRQAYDLKQIKLQLSQNKLSVSALTQQEKCPIHFKVNIHWPDCQEAECILATNKTLHASIKPLTINLKHEELLGWRIRSIQGELSGCVVDLKYDQTQNMASNPHWIPLKGKFLLNLHFLEQLLPSSIAEKLQILKMDSIYTLNGNTWINLKEGSSILEKISFKGELKAEDFSVKDYQIQMLQSHLQYVPGRLDLQDLCIQDPACNIKIPHLMIDLNPLKKHWEFFIPHLTIKNFKPSLLKKIDSSYIQTSTKLRSLVIKRVELQNFSGVMTELATWQSQGSLHFVNPARKNLFHPLLAIPAEIILRLGLDPQVLNPVTGTIYFNLQDNRFYFTRFKDVYSEGRGSKFYLAQTEFPSWMDFDGNLFLQIRMKQYNLIFKIAELFTVSIQGHYKKLRYNLQKHSKGSQKGTSHLTN